MDEPPRKLKLGRVLWRAALLFLAVFCAILGAALLWHPDSRFPNHWNPTTPLAIADPISPLTKWKLRRTANDPVMCQAAVRKYANVIGVAPIPSDNPNCGVEQAITLAGIGQATIIAQTACPTALSLAMWERHSLQAAAKDTIGAPVTEIVDQGSYNCRLMRTSSGSATRWSTHATAMAIDVRGFRFADGQDAFLLRDAAGDDAKAAFINAARDGACRWFSTVLGPEYNALHADHFHLQVRGWGTCQ